MQGLFSKSYFSGGEEAEVEGWKLKVESKPDKRLLTFFDSW
jgi:hypothetical protein